MDWGKGIMGIEAAAQNYFHVSSAQLSPGQAALLAAILPSPPPIVPDRSGPLYPEETAADPQGYGHHAPRRP